MSKTVGRYEIQEELGRGGMAAVYLAFDPRLDRRVALKLMDHQLTGDPAFAARFEREAKTVASLEHGAIVSLYDYGEADGWLYLVMRYMKGGSLKEKIAQGPLAPADAYNVVRRIGAALDKAHGMGVIHRDLKPGNILLDEEGESYLSDFGIVKVAKGEEEFLTETGQTLGTFAYMSPEQLLGHDLDGRSDIYALGIVLYEMLTGIHPYGKVATTSAAMVIAHTQQPIPDITGDNPDLPAALAPVIQKALAKDPADRYASGAAMASAMAAATAGAMQAAPAGTDAATAGAQPAPAKSEPEQPASQPPPAVEQSKSPKWLLPVVGLGAVIVIAILGFLFINSNQGGSSAELTRVIAELTLAADQTQVAAVLTELPGQGAAEQTRVVATLTQEASLTQEAAVALEAEQTRLAAVETEAAQSLLAADQTREAEEALETRMAVATLTQEVTLTEEAQAVEAEQTRSAAELTPTAEPTPLTISFQHGVLPDEFYEDTADVTLSQTAPNINFAGDSACLVDGDEPPGSSDDRSTLLRWDISEIPAGSQVSEVAITLSVFNNTDSSYNLFEVLRPWAEDEVTWNEAGDGDPWQEPGAAGEEDRRQDRIGRLTVAVVGLNELELSDSIVAVVQNWIDDPDSNHGVILANSLSTNGFDFSCSESANTTRRPLLTITYLPGG